MNLKSNPLHSLLDQLGETLTPEVAERIAALRADDETQARLDELADKANEGLLTPAEQKEYEAYITALDIIAILQSKARRVLSRKSA